MYYSIVIYNVLLKIVSLMMNESQDHRTKSAEQEAQSPSEHIAVSF